MGLRLKCYDFKDKNKRQKLPSLSLTEREYQRDTGYVTDECPFGRLSTTDQDEVDR